jgi:hypothetical protein
MPAQLYPLPAGKVPGNFPSPFQDGFFQFLDCFGEVQLGFFLPVFHILDLINEIFNRLLKIKELSVGV